MWFALFGGSTACAMVISWYVRWRRRKRVPPIASSIVKRLEAARTIDDVVRLVRRVAARSPTEDLAERMTNAVLDHHSELSDAQMQRLSRMCREHARSTDARGYSISLVWSSIVAASMERTLVFATEEKTKSLTRRLMDKLRHSDRKPRDR